MTNHTRIPTKPSAAREIVEAIAVGSISAVAIVIGFFLLVIA